mgnify:FL=1
MKKKKFVAYNISAEVLWISRIWEQLCHNPSMVNRRYIIVSGTGTFSFDCKSVVYVKHSTPTSTFTYSPKTVIPLTHFIKSQIPFVSITHLNFHCGIEEIRQNFSLVEDLLCHISLISGRWALGRGTVMTFVIMMFRTLIKAYITFLFSYKKQCSYILNFRHENIQWLI